MNNERKEYTITWYIENYSYCWHKNEEVLSSSWFSADGLEGSVWSIELYPRGYKDVLKGNISLVLRRCEVDDGPENVSLKYQLSLLAADGSILTSYDYEYTFKKTIGYGPHRFFQRDEVLSRRRADYIPDDTLRVQCKIWRGEGNIQPVTHISARTRIGIERNSFVHVVEDFSALEANLKRTIQIASPSKMGPSLCSSLYFTDGSCCEEKIMVEIAPSGSNYILSKCNLSLLDGYGTKIECGEADNRFDATRKDILKLPLSLIKQEILNRKGEFLPNDKLSLSCECIFSTGVEYEKIENILHEKPFVDTNQMSKNDQNKDLINCIEKHSACPSALDDFKEIYNNQLFTDVELKTKTKSFPAHKIVVCARSPVFKAMMTNDMKEKNTNCIEVDDLENDTVQQLLVFLYSDQLANLEWESAIKLYYVGDKYAIEKLKVLCSSFLIENLSTSTASELLLLADTHNDSQLQKAVEDFIFKHEEEVFGSDEWENLIETNPRLVSKTMILKYKRKV